MLRPRLPTGQKAMGKGAEIAQNTGTAVQTPRTRWVGAAMNGKSKFTKTLFLSLFLGLALIAAGCSSSGEKTMEQADPQKSQDNGETGRDARPVQDDSQFSGEARGFPPADERGTGMAATAPPPGDPPRRMEDETVARVDTPPEERDTLMNPETRTDHQSSRALMRENRDLRTDHERSNETLAKIETSSDDPGGASSQDGKGTRLDSAGDSRAELDALDRRDATLDQPDQESRAAMAGRKDDTRTLKAEATGKKDAGMKGETLTAIPDQGEVFVLRRPWAKIRRAPRENSRSIALAYGNDRFQVVKREGDWVQVRFGRNNRHKGWLLLSDPPR